MTSLVMSMTHVAHVSVSTVMRPATLPRMSMSMSPLPPAEQEWLKQQRSRIEREEAELAAEEAALAAFWAAEPPRTLALVGPAGPFCEKCGSRVPHEQTRAKLTTRWQPWMPSWMQGRRVYNCSCGHSGEYAALASLARRPGFEAPGSSVTCGGGSGGAATSDDETRDRESDAATGGSLTWAYDWLVPPGPRPPQASTHESKE